MDTLKIYSELVGNATGLFNSLPNIREGLRISKVILDLRENKIKVTLIQGIDLSNSFSNVIIDLNNDSNLEDPRLVKLKSGSYKVL